LLGLRWQDVNLDKGFITVAQTIMHQRNFDDTAERKTKIYSGAPKSKAGNRIVPLTATTLIKLKTHRKKQLEQRLLMGSAWHDNGLVFASEVGTSIETRKVSTRFHKLLEETNISKRGIHSLRHTFATRAVENNMNVKTLSEILGHEDISTTLNLYVHTTTDTKKDEMNKLEYIFCFG